MHLELKALRGHTRPILAVAYSPDGRQIATGSADHSVKVWDAATGRAVFTFKRDTFTVAFSPDSRRLASAGRDGTVRLWKLGKSFSATDSMTPPLLTKAMAGVWTCAKSAKLSASLLVKPGPI